MLRTSLPAGRVAGLPRDARRTLLPSRRVVARAMDLRDAMRVLRVGEDPPPVTIKELNVATLIAIINGVDDKQAAEAQAVLRREISPPEPFDFISLGLAVLTIIISLSSIVCVVSVTLNNQASVAVCPAPPVCAPCERSSSLGGGG